MRKLYKALSLLLVMLMMAGCFAGCQQAPQDEPKTPDSTATEAPAATDVPEPTEEPRAEQRIVCLAPSMVEVVYALGLGDEIVGWSAYTDYPPEVEQREG